MVLFNYVVTPFEALTVPALSQSTPAQIVATLNTLTQKSQALQAPAESITIVNGPLIVDIIRGYVDIVSTGTTHIQQMEGMALVPAGANADAINTAYTSFVRTHTQLLNTLIGKAGLFQTVPFIGQPMAAVLRANLKT
ncbi:hypothetical protein Slin15195_G042860 [Septoria linicola]|uniref:Uncharacterized protein n=1 Tax=Septoria linicola TaxID=215465 RepID=A0A9Q9ARZ3_9PEZI|nr:hypothetical protein Slin14017_G046380 [Septoria linicola]USW50967.1 hypothetical protein Slin15195_G042860 [Septoria linicola]